MLLIKGSSDRLSGHHLMRALHKQASMSAGEFQRWGQRVVYHSAGPAMQPGFGFEGKSDLCAAMKALAA
jgi:hypothetical protein